MNYTIPEHLDLVKEIDKYLRDKTGGDLYIDLWVKKDFVPFKAIYNMSDFPNYEGRCFNHKFNLSSIFIKVYFEEDEKGNLIIQSGFRNWKQTVNSIDNVLIFLDRIYNDLIEADKNEETLVKEKMVFKTIYKKYFL